MMHVDFRGDEAALKRCIDKGVIKTATKPDGTLWAWGQSEKAVWRKGWKEGSTGQGTKRQVEDKDVETMAMLLHGTEFDFKPLTKSENKVMMKSGKVPRRMTDKLNKAFLVTTNFTNSNPVGHQHMLSLICYIKVYINESCYTQTCGTQCNHICSLCMFLEGTPFGI